MTPEERAGGCRIELNYDDTVHAEATRDGIARAIRAAVQEEREACESAVEHAIDAYDDDGGACCSRTLSRAVVAIRARAGQ